MKKGEAFKEKSIREQVWQIVVVTICLFVVVCAFINRLAKKLVYSNADEHTKITAIRLRDQIDFTYDKIQNYCSSIGEDESIRALLTSDYPRITENIQDVLDCLAKYKILEPTIEDITLVNDRIHYSTVYHYETMDAIRAEMEGDPFRWLGVFPHTFAGASSLPDMLCYGGDLTVDGENIGTVIISLDSTFLQIENENEMNSAYFLIDRKDTLYPFNCSEEMAEEIFRIYADNGGGEELKTDAYYIHAYYFDKMDCYLVGALDIAHTGNGLDSIQILIWTCVILALFFCVLFFLLINRGVVKPLKQFGDTMHQIREMRQRRLSTALNLEGCAEMQEIGKEFKDMLDDIDSMHKQIFQSATDLYEMKVQKQEAELAYLRSQIDPHFLYNTLEVVRKMALVKDAPEIAQMAVDMGKIFRYSTKGNYEVTLEEELSIIKSYIRIQQMRFQGKIEVYYFIPEEVLGLRVIKMLLQPIVENSIFHGLEPKKGQGSLFIGARKEGGRLFITVKDDGIGIPADSLAKLQEDLASENMDTRRHVGILNTNARILLQYGREYGLTVESCEEDGTTITMVLPVQEMKEG